jgi:nucleoid DNA-binding protein
MTRKELIQRIQEGLPRREGAEGGGELSQRQIAEVVDQLFEEVVGALRGEGRYVHPGFGTFTVKVQNAREGRNPFTGEVLRIPEGVTVSFKPSADLRGRLKADRGPG